jgi:RNA polymerase sigma-70 factor (ECF subfamily)
MDLRQLPRYLRQMNRVLSRRGRKREEIEDLMQDAFVRLLEYCEKGAEVREPEAVLVRTVQRLSMNFDRDERRGSYVEEALENLPLEHLGPSPEEVLAGEQCLDKARRTLDSVSRRTREVFFMQRLEGLSYAQISRQMGLPVSTVEKHMARAMTVLLEERRREKLAARQGK